jgi:hypothetical protein
MGKAAWGAVVIAAIAIPNVGGGLAPPPAQAAYFTSVPPLTYYSSGAGPLEWWFSSSDPGGENGWVAWKLSTDQYWSRCQGQSNHVALSNLPDGLYTIAIADDINLTYWNDLGLLYSSHTQPCRDSPPEPPSTPRSTDYFYVDTVPPSVSSPQIATNGKTVQLVIDATDRTTGIGTIAWSMGDGITQETTTPYITYTFLNYGAYDGHVDVADRAGNTTSVPFQVTLAPPAQSPTANQSPEAKSQQFRLRLRGPASQRVLRQRGVVIFVESDRAGTFVARATVAVPGASRVLKFRKLRKTVAAGVRTKLRLRLSGSARLAIRRALALRTRLTARVTVTARDRAGTSSSAKRRIRLRP